MTRAVSLEMSKDGAWWKCGGNVRKISSRQAERVLERLAEIFAAHAAKHGK
jgi:hypothetical protein